MREAAARATPAGMIEPVADISADNLARFDAIIDVRSPSEFAEDRIPGAINLPVLDDAERALVGTIYVQESRFRARRIGAALVARNVARHLEENLADRPPAFRPLIYCWRGGMRSNAMATILSQIGWRVGVLAGGYKTWRRRVVEELRRSEAPLNLVLLDGRTGAAKSQTLARVAAKGGQAVDLEALAAHRGSVFGALRDARQPSQKFFESQLWRALSAFDPARPILVEAESARIGAITLPRRLWAAMKRAPSIVVEAPIGVRARNIVEAYRDLVADRGAIAAAIDRLAPFHPKERLEDWRALAEAGEDATLAADLMRVHYDPLYDRSRRRREAPTLATLRLAEISPDALDGAAAEIIRLMARTPG